MKTKTRFWLLVTVIVACCLLMMLTDGIWQPGYWVKSAVKIAVFLVLPLAISPFLKLPVLEHLRPDKASMLKGGLLGLATVTVILGAYFLLGSYIDLSAVPRALEQDTGITKDNFIFVALYIALCNSFLEEFFFRGFAYLRLKEETGKTFAAVFSSALFALYHAGMLITMLNPLLYILALAALFFCGLFFIYLDRRGNLWAAWLVHIGANIGINLIAMILLGIL